MNKTIKMPLTQLSPVLKLLTELGVHVEEFAVSDSYVYRNLNEFMDHGFRDEFPKKFKLDGNETYITTRSDPRTVMTVYDHRGCVINRQPDFAEAQRQTHWTLAINPETEKGSRTERYINLQTNYYKIFRVNKKFIDEIIIDIGKGNRKNYTKMKGFSRIVKKKEVVYNEWRIATLKKLQFVIKEGEVISLLEEQARKLQESGLATV